MQSSPVEIDIMSSKKKLIKALRNYYLHNIDETFDKNDSNEKQRLIQRIKISNIVIIDKFIYNDKSNIYFVIGFNETVIIIQDSSIKLLQHLFSNNMQLKFYFLHNSKDIFDKNNEISKDRLFQYSDEFDEEIDNFSKIFKINHPRGDQISQMQDHIKSCISGYLIGESYFKLIEEQKIDFSTAFNKEANQKEGEKPNIKEWAEEEYIELRYIGSEYFFKVDLIYEIETEHLFAAKKANSIEEEIPKLYKREYENYLLTNYPLIPKFYGKQEKNNCLIIQYIHGRTLDKIDITKLTLEDKITIIFELMLIIQYLHNNKFVYRDLKANNVIFDGNKTVFLIDFDRMIKLDSSKSELEDHTNDFATKFAAPEVNLGDISYKNDIFSLGMMIEYLELSKENDKINSLFLKCISYTADERPSIFELWNQFYSIFIQLFDKIFIFNFPEIQYLRANIYYEGKYIDQDINKSIYYLSLAANQNHSDAQNELGIIYCEGKYISRDINKSIHYLSLAANQNHPIAQFNLGNIYYEGKYISRDIDKSIHYYSLAANQNDPNTKFMLEIYYKKNMIKAIDFFIRSASNGNVDAQFAVGYFYHEGKHVERDISKSIHHYKEASTFNNQYAKNNLGIIYRFGCGEIQPNCGLSMDYFEEAIRRFNDKVSMYNLAHIYIYEDKNKNRLNKSIELLIESTRQGFSPSTELLCIVLIKLFGFNIEIIHEELNKLTEKFSILSELICRIIINQQLLYEPIYEQHYKSLSAVNYLYNMDRNIISTKIFNESKPVLTRNITGKNITKEFYEGFGNS